MHAGCKHGSLFEMDIQVSRGAGFKQKETHQDEGGLMPGAEEDKTMGEIMQDRGYCVYTIETVG